MKWFRWFVAWCLLFSLFFVQNQIADGFWGPIRLMFCIEGKCSLEAFSISRVVQKSIESKDHVLLSLVGAYFLALISCIALWNFRRRAKRTSKPEQK